MQRKKLRTFLLTKELVMLGFVILSFAFLILEHLELLSESQLRAVEVYEVVVAVLFMAEFVFELYYARDRKKYLKTHWFYLVAAIPVPTTTFEILRGVRALRLLKLLKIFSAYRYEHNTKLFVR